MDNSSSSFGFMAVLLALLVMGGGIGAATILSGGGGSGDRTTPEMAPIVQDDETEEETGDETEDEGGWFEGDEAENPEEGGETPEPSEPTPHTEEAEKVGIVILPKGTEVRFTGNGETVECVGGRTCELVLSRKYDYMAKNEMFVQESGTITATKTTAICLNLDWSPYEEDDFNVLGAVKGACANGKGKEIYNNLVDVYNTPEAEEGNIWE